MSMLPRALQRPLARLPYTKRACDTCACRCGASFQSQPFSISSRRAAVRSPSTWDKEQRGKTRGLTPQQARRRQELLQNYEQTKNKERHAQINQAYSRGTFSKHADHVDAFMLAFSNFSNNTKLRVGVDAPDSFRRLVEAFEMTEQDLMFLAIMMIRNKHSDSDRYWGKKLMDTLSAAGFAEATIRIMTNSLVASKKMPGILRNAGTAAERGRLQKIARAGTNSRAMVLEGKVAYALGDSDTAIKWWWQAIDEAVAKGNTMIARRAAGKKPVADMAGLDNSDLSTPWIELIEAHFDRLMLKGKNQQHEREQCRKAIEIGVEQDDPTAFYYAATFYKKRDSNGDHVPTSHWLYHMTKAAASGVPKAAYELGVYYAESGWRYIEDEPPDHVKPTPFDSYPAPWQDKLTSLWDRYRQLFSSKTVEVTKASDEMFHSAAWPSTPTERLTLALEWLKLACDFRYAPAYLYIAKLHLEDSLWSGAQAPQAALDLAPGRYLYASKDERDNAEFDGKLRTYEPADDIPNPPNPVRSDEVAKEALLHVIMARIAVLHRARIIDSNAKRPGKRDEEWEDIEDVVHARAQKDDSQRAFASWYADTEVFDMWQKDSLALYLEAARICDHRQWTLYDHGGRLVYKHGTPQGAGLFEGVRVDDARD